MKLPSRRVLLTIVWLTLPVAAACAADIAPTIRVVRDIAYSGVSAEPGQTLDPYLSEQEPGDRRPRPAVHFVHGGAWRKGDKSMVGAKPAAFLG